MDKNYLIKLTNELYRLTLLFPKKEPLRYKMRELADAILANCLTSCSSPGDEHRVVLEDLGVLDSYFEVAKSQNWVPVVEILRIQEEYDRIRAELKKILKRQPEIIVEEKITQVRPVQTREGLLERQEKILEFLKEKGKAQVWEIKEIFSDVSKRTLRRDFGHLLKQGKIERLGERNETSYQIKPL